MCPGQRLRGLVCERGPGGVRAGGKRSSGRDAGRDSGLDKQFLCRSGGGEPQSFGGYGRGFCEVRHRGTEQGPNRTAPEQDINGIRDLVREIRMQVLLLLSASMA